MTPALLNEGGIAVPRGNLAAPGAIIKPAAASGIEGSRGIGFPIGIADGLL